MAKPAQKVGKTRYDRATAMARTSIRSNAGIKMGGQTEKRGSVRPTKMYGSR